RTRSWRSQTGRGVRILPRRRRRTKETRLAAGSLEAYLAALGAGSPWRFIIHHCCSRPSAPLVTQYRTRPAGKKAIITPNTSGMNCIIFCCIGSMPRSEEHTSELQSRENLVCRLLLEKKKMKIRDD